ADGDRRGDNSRSKSSTGLATRGASKNNNTRIIARSMERHIKNFEHMCAIRRSQARCPKMLNLLFLPHSLSLSLSREGFLPANRPWGPRSNYVRSSGLPDRVFPVPL